MKEQFIFKTSPQEQETRILDNILCTVEPLYCGHLGDLVKCPVYSGTPLLWTPWGHGEVSCIQWNPSIVDTLGTW